MQGGDEVGGARNFEVHVAECVFGAEDVGERHIAFLAVDHIGHEAHGDAGDGGFERHTSVVEGQGGCAHGAHGGGAVRAERFGNLPDGVGEFFPGGDDGHEGAFR